MQRFEESGIMHMTARAFTLFSIFCYNETFYKMLNIYTACLIDGCLQERLIYNHGYS